MVNPFEDPDATYLVVVNGEFQYSLWPSARPVPAGWSSSYGPFPRDECLEYIERSWTDMRPLSLRTAMER